MKNKLASINIFSWEFIWLLFCGFMTIVWMSEVWDVKTAPEKYACLWGGEGPVARLWYYASESLYLLHLACLIVWFLSMVSQTCIAACACLSEHVVAHGCSYNKLLTLPIRLAKGMLLRALHTSLLSCAPCPDIWGYPY